MDQEAFFREKVERILKKAKAKGASEAEVILTHGEGFSLNVRNHALETIEHNEDQGMDITVYFGQKKGSADTSDLSDQSLDEALNAACHIAEFTIEDPCAGLPDKDTLATEQLDLDLYHPYPHDIDWSIEKVKACERIAFDFDPRIVNSEGAQFNTYSCFGFYGNSLGFMSANLASSHDISLSMIAEEQGHKERDYSFTTARRLEDLWSNETLAFDAAKRTISRLNPRKIKTQKVPILFEASLAGSLIGSFFKGISGGNLYRKTSCFLDSLETMVFPETLSLYEDPFIQRGLGSAPFDGEGVAIHPQFLVENGRVKTYLLSTYSARQLKTKTTGHGGGVRNVFVQSKDTHSLTDLLHAMETGLLVTELIGQGLNLLTGDYSRGASGFWVEDGVIQHPVSEITIAGNIKDMLKQIIGVGNDVETRHRIQTGSLLIENMMVAGDNA